jgi:hypothetical protein
MELVDETGALADDRLEAAGDVAESMLTAVQNRASFAV